MKDAYFHDDDRRAEGEFMRIDENGIPHKVMPEVLADDICTFWRLKERWLYAIITICCIYFFMVII